MKPTVVSQFIEEINGGVTEQQLSNIISKVATAVIDNAEQGNGKGEVTLSLKFKRTKVAHPSGATVEVAAKLAYKQPKARGTLSEDDTSTSIFHVNKDGTVTLFPVDQFDLLNGQIDKATGEVKNAS